MNPDLKVLVASLSAHSDRIRAICNCNQENADFETADRLDADLRYRGETPHHYETLQAKVMKECIVDVMRALDLDAETAEWAIFEYW